MAYIPNATDSAQPVESQAVESAALEFRTLKSRVNGLQAAVEAEDLKDLRVPEATVPEIPTAAVRAGKVLGFDAGGNPIAVAVSGVDDPSLRSDLAVPSGSALVGDNDGAGGALWTTVRGFIARLVSSAGASVIGFIQLGGGAVQRTVQSKLRESVSVKDFSAVGDGVEDDTNAIQAGLNSLAASGGILHFPAGSYLTTSTLVIPNNVTLCGEGIGVSIIRNTNVIGFEEGRVFKDALSSGQLIVYGNSLISEPQKTITAASASYRVLTLSLTDLASFSVGDYVLVTDSQHATIGTPSTDYFVTAFVDQVAAKDLDARTITLKYGSNMVFSVAPPNIFAINMTSAGIAFSKNITIKDLSVYSSEYLSGGIGSFGGMQCDNLVLDNVGIYGAIGYSANTTINSSITRCDIKTSWTSVELAMYSTRCKVKNNFCHGVDVHHPGNAIGLITLAEGASDHTIEGNELLTNNYTLGTSTGILSSGNGHRIANNSVHGVLSGVINYSNNSIISANSITRSVYGIIDSGVGSKIINNFVYGSTYPILVEATASPTCRVSGNTLEGCLYVNYSDTAQLHAALAHQYIKNNSSDMFTYANLVPDITSKSLTNLQVIPNAEVQISIPFTKLNKNFGAIVYEAVFDCAWGDPSISFNVGSSISALPVIQTAVLPIAEMANWASVKLVAEINLHKTAVLNSVMSVKTSIQYTSISGVTVVIDSEIINEVVVISLGGHEDANAYNLVISPVITAANIVGGHTFDYGLRKVTCMAIGNSQEVMPKYLYD